MYLTIIQYYFITNYFIINLLLHLYQNMNNKNNLNNLNIKNHYYQIIILIISSYDHQRIFKIILF